MPPFANSVGHPLGNAFSITKYSHSSAFTNGATKLPIVVLTVSNPSILSFPNISTIEASGLGVILSIIDHGNATLFLSSM